MIDVFIDICSINASAKPPRKEIYSQDTKYEPENEADQQDVENGRYGTDEGIDNHLREARQGKGYTQGAPNTFSIFSGGTQCAGLKPLSSFVFTLTVPLPDHNELCFLLTWPPRRTLEEPCEENTSHMGNPSPGMLKRRQSLPGCLAAVFSTSHSPGPGLGGQGPRKTSTKARGPFLSCYLSLYPFPWIRTFIPSNLESARRGLSALRVRKDFKLGKFMRLTTDTCGRKRAK